MIGKKCWEPSANLINSSNMMEFIRYVNVEENISISSYNELYKWSIENSDQFWLLFSRFSEIIFLRSFNKVVDDISLMPGASWFQGSRINYANNLLRFSDDKEALIFYGENKVRKVLTYKELKSQVAKLSYSLKNMGIMKGDRVAALTANVPEAVVSMLATSSIGAIWSSCSPDFGVSSIIERFKQISPKILISTNGYYFKGKVLNSFNKIVSILDKLHSVEKLISIKYIKEKNEYNSLQIPCLDWEDLIDNSHEGIVFESLPFNHPLFIMYSSGTTGKPKSIVHSSGGTLIQHLKELMLHTDIKRDDTIFYFTTCGWMMWNWLVSSLALGARVLLYDGNAFHPTEDYLLKIAIKEKVTIFGTSAKYLSEIQKRKILPKKIGKFKNLRTILSTGSPLEEENYDYVYKFWKSNVQLSSICGGTDIISCFFLGNPMLPVYKGKLQSIGLGMSVKSYSIKGDELPYGQKGELVCDKAFPSMPIYFWNDEENKKYLKAYFNVYPGIWRHGDFISIDEKFNVKVYGRSDSTLNPGGVRIGTSEIYSVLDTIQEIEDSLVIGRRVNSDEEIIFFLKMKTPYDADEDFKEFIISTIKENCSPRHCPNKIISVQDIPYTINGKKVEVAVKKIINGELDYNIDAVKNPSAIKEYINIFKNRFTKP